MSAPSRSPDIRTIRSKCSLPALLSNAKPQLLPFKAAKATRTNRGPTSPKSCNLRKQILLKVEVFASKLSPVMSLAQTDPIYK